MVVTVEKIVLKIGLVQNQYQKRKGPLMEDIRKRNPVRRISGESEEKIWVYWWGDSLLWYRTDMHKVRRLVLRKLLETKVRRRG